MKAINYYLVIDKIKSEPKKIAGLIMTEATDDEGRYVRGKVITAGNLVEGVVDGDVVSYDKAAAHAITWKDDVFYVIKVSDIIIVE
tara:strand:- start:1335 stop:1592 length:258 start_codon:yes stop_codon:yes gene_type:complete